MSESFEWPEVDAWVAGTVGPPGARVFYVQVRLGGDVRTLRAEKHQVGALAQYLEALLVDLPSSEDEMSAATAELLEPVDEAWVMGNIGLTYDDDEDAVVVEVHELVPEDEEGASARIRATRAQARAFAQQAAALVVAGRPTCPLCGHPINPEGHVCPRSNGQSRPSS